MRPSTLPEADADALALSQRLSEHLRAQIAQHGPIRFARYMDLVLYAPGMGYYAAGSRKFGAGGDFITAPELGGVLAEAWAQVLTPVLQAIEQPQIMELGAGSGALAVDLLQALARRGIALARYAILERSADLRERQQQRIASAVPAFADRVVWLDAPPTAAFDGAIIGNEVVDALACSVFVMRADGPREIGVDERDGQLVEVELPPSTPLSAAVAHLQAQGVDLPSGYRSEVIPELGAWLASVSAGLRNGVVLLADYGYGRPEYYHPERRTGTLICHYRHRAHADPYWLPGLNDLSASVDFTALAEAGRDCGLDLLCYDHQAGFLISAGLEQIYAQLDAMSDHARLRLTQQLKQLMLPGIMGERFKLMALGRGPAAHYWPIDGAGQRRLL